MPKARAENVTGRKDTNGHKLRLIIILVCEIILPTEKRTLQDTRRGVGEGATTSSLDGGVVRFSGSPFSSRSYGSGVFLYRFGAIGKTKFSFPERLPVRQSPVERTKRGLKKSSVDERWLRYIGRRGEDGRDKISPSSNLGGGVLSTRVMDVRDSVLRFSRDATASRFFRTFRVDTFHPKA